HKGRRTRDADLRARCAIDGLTLATSAPAIFKALVEATAFGSRAINERFVEQGIPVERIVAIGGIARKSPFVMQTLADVMGLPIRVHDSDQACALGAAIFAAAAAGVYPTIAAAQQAMCPGFSAEYRPNPDRHAIYDRLYERYKRLGAAQRGE
ncbi:MAG: ribulokinase, partial [Alistipes sp.]|nr:ribulokinase [Alistipes sp.]